MSVLAIVIVCVLFSALFSGMEIAFISSNKLHIELESKKGTYRYRLLSYLNRKPSRFIAALLVGNNIALVVFGLFMPELLKPLTSGLDSEGIIFIVEIFISTLVILFLAEFLPKSFFSTHADQLSKLFALPGYLIYWLFYPIVSFIMTVSNALLRWFTSGNAEETTQIFERVDLDHYIRERTEGQDDQESVDSEIKIFQNALEFSTRKAREFMIPRTEIVSIDESESIERLRREFVSSGLSKILIHRDSVDEILGYVHSFELFKKPKDFKSILRPISFIPESMTANEILKLLLKEKRSIAVVLDEFGGTSGLITIEDVVEELFGEIDDEHDKEEFTEKVLPDGEYVFSGRLELDYLNEEYRLNLPESDNYHTIGGLVMHFLGSIPEKGERFDYSGWHFTITKAASTRIEELRIRRIED